MRRTKSKDETMCESIAAALGASSGTPKPPQSWWEEHKDTVRKQHPNYDEEKVNRAVGAIWYKIYKPDKRELAVMAEALKHS